MNLISTADKVQAVLSSAADTETYADYMDATGASGVVQPDTFKPGNEPHSRTSAATHDVVGAPGSDVIRIVKFISIRNKHASTAQTVTLQRITTGPATTEICKVTLQAGEELLVNENGSWFVYDTNGGVKMGASAASATLAGLVELADAAEMEAATDTARAVVPGLQHRHPGHPKAFCQANGAGTTVNASYGVSSITDTGAGLLTINWSTNFSAATGYTVNCSCERTATALTVTDLKDVGIRFNTLTASAVTVECWDDTATTHVQEDPQSYHVIALGDQ